MQIEINLSLRSADRSTFNEFAPVRPGCTFSHIIGVNKASAQATGHGQLATRPAVNLISDQSDEVDEAGHPASLANGE